VSFVPEMDGIIEHLMQRIEPGQQIIFFGGDDLFELADRFIERVRGN
jgi:hypothetical protein